MHKPLFLILLLSFAAAAQQPRIVNAKLETRPVAAGLEREFRALVAAQTAPAWIGYAVPAVAGEHNMCCYNSRYCCAGCSLEGEAASRRAASPAGPIPLEPTHLLVLFRAEQQAVEKIRTFSLECELDAGGLPFYWLTGVRPAESIALLATFATAPETTTRGRSRTHEPAVSAIALHADPALGVFS